MPLTPSPPPHFDDVTFEVTGVTYEDLLIAARTELSHLSGEHPFRFSLDVHPHIQSQGAQARVSLWRGTVTGHVRRDVRL